MIDETEWIRGKVPITYVQITEKDKSGGGVWHNVPDAIKKKLRI